MPVEIIILSFLIFKFFKRLKCSVLNQRNFNNFKLQFFFTKNKLSVSKTDEISSIFFNFENFLIKIIFFL